MRRLIAIGLAVVVLSITSTAVANMPGTSGYPEGASAVPHELPASVIDGIAVPFEVLNYAQLKYQGHAVTQVMRTSYQGRSAYQLRVDNDDILHDDDCIFLYYDMSWKLAGEGKAAASSRPKFEYKYEWDESGRGEPREPRRAEPREPRSNSGRGGYEPAPDPIQEPDQPILQPEEPAPEKPRGRGHNQ